MSDATAPLPFGTYHPSVLQAAIITVGSRLTPTMGRHLNKALRSGIRRMSSAPVDVEVLGMRMRLHASGNVCEKRLLVSPQMFDPEELDLLRGAIRPGFVFVDIGANAGIYSLYVATRADANSRILAIEPHPIARQRLNANLGFNDIANVTVVPVVVSDAAGDVELLLDANNIGTSSIIAAHIEKPSGKSMRVEARTLLDVLATNDIRYIDAIKIDIEGAEDRALGPFFANAPTDLLPKLVIIEDSRATWGHDLIGQICERGYRYRRLTSANIALERTLGA